MPKRKADSKPLAGNQDLAEELAALGRLIRDYDGATARPVRLAGDKVVAVARLCRDLPLSEWQTLMLNPDFRHWMAFPLDADAFPFLAQLEERLEELAFQTEHDPLTGLYNRRAFERLRDAELVRSSRQDSYLSLAIFDLDNFKVVNDTYGHPAGDLALKAMAETLLAHKRPYDVAARIGGEEFALILPGAGPIRAMSIVDRLLKLFRAKVFQDDKGRTFRVTFSAGLAHFKGSRPAPPGELMSLADGALYQAKNQGKNRVVAVKTPEEPGAPKATMVHSDEKKFLFSGTH